MKLSVIVLVFVCLTAANAQQSMTLEELRKMKKTKSTAVRTDPPKNVASAPVENKGSILTEGSYSKIEKPFVFIARDADTYAMLGKMIGDFEATEVDFTKYAVVAAFAGEKATGGYSVSIKLNEGKCEIKDVSPAHGAIVTEALTKPFAVVKLPVEEEGSLELVVGETWKSEMDKYRITSGTFEFTGGFLGISKKFNVEGSISTIKHGDYITMVFDVREAGDDAVRRMSEAGSGKLNEFKPSIARLEGGSLIDRPHPPLMVTTAFEENRLILDFTPGKRGYVVSDGFEGKGHVEAEIVSAP